MGEVNDVLDTFALLVLIFLLIDLAIIIVLVLLLTGRL